MNRKDLKHELEVLILGISNYEKVDVIRDLELITKKFKESRCK